MLDLWDAVDIMETAIEDLQLEIEGMICGLSTDKLGDVAEHLKVDITAYTNKGRRVLAKKLREEIDKLVEEHEDKLSFLKDIVAHITGQSAQESVEVTGEGKTATDEEHEKAKKEYEELQKKFQQMVEDQKKLLEEAQKKIKASSKSQGQPQGNEVIVTPNNAETVSTSNYNVANSLLRREFKIAGTIGGESTKDKLSFVGLIRQIDSGLLKGYEEREIIDAIVRAVSSGSKLKAYLEMTTEITLPKLRQILRAHYQEKSGSELYQELTTLVQGQKETSSDFLLRAMSLRERVIFTSQEETGIKYEAALVKSLFKHAVETGLRNEVVRNKLRPMLHTVEITDEQLMEHLNKIVSEESERQLKFGSQTNAPRDPAALRDTSAENKQSKKVFNLQATLEAVQSELAELKTRVNASHNSGSVPNSNLASNGTNGRRKRRMCTACEESNANRCNHCFKCGSNDHFARGCKSSGNANALQPRDRK